MSSNQPEAASNGQQHHRILIIGAGFSGLGLGIRLRQAGEEDFLILDQAGGVGGTWWVNRYPGCACDVQSHLYSLSFAPKPDWTRHFAPRAEIQAYLEHCASAHCLGPHLRLNTQVEQARWDDRRQIWKVTDQLGRVKSCNILVPAIGGLSSPAFPSIPGLDQFPGPVIHSQQWPEQIDLSGKRVAVIGTGASAIQFVPKIQPEADHLDIYQRSPQWILPKPDRAIPSWRQRLYRRFPPARLLFRFSLYCLLESRLPAFNRFPQLSRLHRRMAARLRRRQITDPELLEKLTPDYAMGCKRVLMSNDYYPALSKANVELITRRLERIEAHQLIDESGQIRSADIIILGTGFRATAPVPPGMILGRNGLDLAAHWERGPSAYKGTSVHGFPNLFMLLGPNTALGHNSVLLMIEAQINYLLDALAWYRRTGTAALEVSKQAQLDWVKRLDRKLQRTVWNRGGCASWYLHPDSGRNTTLWPDYTWRFRHQTRRFDVQAYRPLATPEPLD